MEIEKKCIHSEIANESVDLLSRIDVQFSLLSYVQVFQLDNWMLDYLRIIIGTFNHFTVNRYLALFSLNLPHSCLENSMDRVA